MRCKKHPTDLSSSVGVCASCLRQRLLALIAAQAQAQAQSHLHHSHSRGATSDDHRPPPLVFPRSVSPYVTRRKSDDTHTWHHHHLFYSTPQVGPTYGSVNTTTDFTASRSHRKKTTRFSLLSNLFGSRSDKLSPDLKSSDPGVCHRYSCDASSSSPSSWFSTIFSARRKKQSVMYIEDAIAGDRKGCRIMDRGMSPARGADTEEWERLSSAEASPGKWRRTPALGPSTVRRTRQGHGKNVSGLTFCLSPLVRASPSRQWSKSGMPADMAFGEVRTGPIKPHLSTAASFCANRSRKLVDLGRVNHNR